MCVFLFVQVEAALTNDPESDELLKLKSDLNVSELICDIGASW